ncbi:MAG: hypothetical protein V4729_05120 [Pseudomonadota bacterium]
MTVARLRCRALTAVFLALLAGAAGAGVVVVEGGVAAAAYDAALAQRMAWFQRAVNVCTADEACDKPVVMRIAIAATGKVSDCRLIETDIRNPQTADLFCQIARSAAFPAAAGPVLIEHHLGVQQVFQNGRERCPATLGERRGNPAFVRQCLDDLLEVVDATRSSEHHQYGAPLEDMTGNMRLRLTIKPNGKVSDVDVLETDIRGWNFRRGIVRLVEAIEFGPAEKRETHEVQFSVPFTGTRDP